MTLIADFLKPDPEATTDILEVEDENADVEVDAEVESVTSGTVVEPAPTLVLVAASTESCEAAATPSV